jgi:hypothetical protein
MKKKAHEEFMMFESLIIIQNIQAFSNYVTIFLYFRCILMAGGLEIPFPEATQQRRGVININKLGGNLAYNTNKRGYLYDIAILEVNAPFVLSPQVIPAILPAAKTPTGRNLIVSGWGYTSQGTLQT